VKTVHKGLFLLLLLGFFISACGSPGDPFEMATTTTQVVGDLEPPAEKFLFDPEEQSAQGTLTAQVEETFINRRTLTIQAFEIINNFSSVGPIRMVLNPNFESTATIYRLNMQNQVAGTHTMTLFLIVETADQNLTYDNVMLASDQAVLELAQDLPILGFLFDDEAKQLQTLGLSVTVPAQLIDSPFDPN